MTEPVRMVCLGSFGQAVLRYLRGLRNDVEEAGDEGPAGRIYIIAAWRPAPDVCAALDEVSHTRKRPFVPLIVDGTALCLGPVIIPGQEGCWDCWMRRSRQRARQLERRSAVLQHYADHHDAGPKGYLEPFASMGAARLSQTIDALDVGTAAAGSVWQIDMLTREIAASTLVGVHDCPRCGLHRPPETRAVEGMRRALGYLWEQ